MCINKLMKVYNMEQKLLDQIVSEFNTRPHKPRITVIDITGANTVRTPGRPPAHRNAKCVVTPEGSFSSVKQAADAHGVSVTTIYSRLKDSTTEYYYDR